MLKFDYGLMSFEACKWVMFRGMFFVNPEYEGEFLSKHTDCQLNKVEISA